MYTLEEIKEEAKAKGWKMFWIWLLTFGLGFPALMLILSSVIGTDVKFDDETIEFLITSMITTVLPLALFTAGIMSAVAFYGTKKKLKEENEQEEKQNREDHYRKMEEMLKRMSKDKE